MVKINPITDATIKKVLATANCHNMLKYGDSILVSLSGGPDSIFLVNFLYLIREIFSLELYCFHLDHKTRGGLSEEDAKFVEEFCRKKGLILFKEEVNVKEWVHKRKMTFQEGARILRLELLNKIAKKNSIKKIATGHTADDNIETFFMHLLRGAGTRGLAGIKPVDGSFIRPLIEIFREEILTYLSKNRINYCVDSSNLENIYFRNKIRNLLLPFIAGNITHGDFKKRIANTVKILREENDFLSGFAKDCLKELKANLTEKRKNTSASPVTASAEKQIEVSLKKLESYPDALKKRIIISAIEEIKGDAEDLKSINIDRILKICSSGGESRKIALSGKMQVTRESDRLTVRMASKKSQPTGRKAGNMLQEYKFAEASDADGRTLMLEHLKLKFVSKVAEGNIDTIKNKKISDMEACLDYDKIVFPVFVTFYHTGSGREFMPLGMKNFKKLHDYFIDRKVPKSMRPEVPVFHDAEKVLWLGGYRIDDRARLDVKTKKIFNIKIIHI